MKKQAIGLAEGLKGIALKNRDCKSGLINFICSESSGLTDDFFMDAIRSYSKACNNVEVDQKVISRNKFLELYSGSSIEDGDLSEVIGRFNRLESSVDRKVFFLNGVNSELQCQIRKEVMGDSIDYFLNAIWQFNQEDKNKVFGTKSEKTTREEDKHEKKSEALDNNPVSGEEKELNQKTVSSGD